MSAYDLPETTPEERQSKQSAVRAELVNELGLDMKGDPEGAKRAVREAFNHLDWQETPVSGEIRTNDSLKAMALIQFPMSWVTS